VISLDERYMKKVSILWPVVDLFKGENQSLGIMSISGVLKRSGYRSQVVEANYKKIKRKLLKKNPPAVIAYNTPTVFARAFLELNKRLKKEFQFFAVFGGPHPTFFPEMIEENGVDGICRGEGEYPFLELLENLSSGRSVTKITNWWIKEDGKIHKNPVRHLIQDLAQLPLPDHDLFRKAIPHSIWYAPVMTSRGCPYNCTYCFNHVYKGLYRDKGKYVRRRSVENVLEELREIKKNKCYKFIKFGDDIFTLSPDWLEEFCPRYREEIGLPFSCLVRANHINPKIVRLLKDAGCHRMTLGMVLDCKLPTYSESQEVRSRQILRL
jgi:radical SAM superfamily enzyme YgiQ (UPF0313 family)